MPQSMNNVFIAGCRSDLSEQRRTLSLKFGIPKILNDNTKIGSVEGNVRWQFVPLADI
jgi:hypothetical protein